MKNGKISKVLSHLKKDDKEFMHQIEEDKILAKELKGRKMKKQSYKDRMDEHLGAKHGKESKHKQSMKDRRHEEEGEHSHHHHLKEAMKHMRHAAKKMK